MAENLAALEYDNILLQRSAVASAKRERAAAAAATLRCVLRAAQRLTLALSWGRWLSMVAAVSMTENTSEQTERTGSGVISHMPSEPGAPVIAALSMRGPQNEHHDGSALAGVKGAGGASPVDSTLLGMPCSRIEGRGGDAPKRPPLHQMDSTMSAVSLAHETELLWPQSQPQSRSLSRSPSLGRAAMRKAQR